MAKFLIGTVPVIGHVKPLVPIVKRLLEQGHEVGWYTGKRFQPLIEELGAIYFPMHHALDYSEEAQVSHAIVAERESLRGLNQLKFDLQTFFVNGALGQFQDLSIILTQFAADVIVGDSFFLGASWISEKFSLPWAQVGVTVFAMDSVDTAPFGLGLLPSSSKLGRIRNRVLNYLSYTFLFKDLLTQTNRLRASIELPSTDKSFQNDISPYLYLMGSVESFEYPRSDLPAQVHFVGPFLAQERSRNFIPPLWWEDLQDASQPVILVTQGTISTHLEHLVLPTIQALEAEDVWVIVTTGNGHLEERDIASFPSHIKVESFIPFDVLLPYVDVMVTNGGFNGVMMALANAVPLVVAGKSEDKAEASSRIQYAGVGINLKTDTPSAKMIQNAVKQVLQISDFKTRAQMLQADIQKTYPSTSTVKLLELLADSAKPVTDTAVVN